jgi:hypothetical protein
MSPPKFQRILLKISGEVLAGEQGAGIDPNVIDKIAEEINEESLPAQMGWNGLPPITWECWRRF